MVFVFLPFLNFSMLIAEDYSLAIGAIFRNEEPYLKEWIEFHRLVGVEHFYLCNNLSTDRSIDVLKPYIKKGIVELIDWPFDSNNRKEWQKVQLGAYDYILNLARNRAKWVAFIDSDEFLFPVKKKKLQDVLNHLEEFGGVAVNWQNFGTSHVSKIPKNKLLIETLIYKAPKNWQRNRFTKSIVQPKFVKNYFRNAHIPNFVKGAYNVNTKGEKILKVCSSYVLIDQLCINHYWTRDENYFQNVKLARLKRRNFKINDQAEETNQIKDKTIFRFIPKLKKSLKSSV
jgi:hypothetical protein